MKEINVNREISRLVAAATACFEKSEITFSSNQEAERLVQKIGFKNLYTVALYADAMRTLSSAILADGVFEASEASYCFSFLGSCSSIYSRIKPTYKSYQSLTEDRIKSFVSQYMDDKSIFGYKHEPTKWLGLEVSRSLDRFHPSNRFHSRFVNVLVSITEGILALDGFTLEETQHLMKLKSELMGGSTPAQTDDTHKNHGSTMPSKYADDTKRDRVETIDQQTVSRWATSSGFRRFPPVWDATACYSKGIPLFNGAVATLFTDFEESMGNISYQHAVVITEKNNPSRPLLCICCEYQSRDRFFFGTFDRTAHNTWGELNGSLEDSDAFFRYAISFAELFNVPCRTDQQIRSLVGISIEEYETIFESYEQSLNFFATDNTSTVNDNISEHSRNISALSESEIFHAKSDFSQAVRNRVITRLVTDGVLEPYVEKVRPQSESNTSGVIKFEYPDRDEHLKDSNKSDSIDIPAVISVLSDRGEGVSSLLYNKGLAQLDQGDAKAAVQNFEASIMANWDKSEPSNCSTWSLRAETLNELGQGNAKQALDLYNKAFEHIETSPAVAYKFFLASSAKDAFFLWGANNASCVASTQGNLAHFEDGESVSQVAIALAQVVVAQTGWQCWNFIDTLADAYINCGCKKEARKCLEIAIAVTSSMSDRQSLKKKLSSL